MRKTHGDTTPGCGSTRLLLLRLSVALYAPRDRFTGLHRAGHFQPGSKNHQSQVDGNLGVGSSSALSLEAREYCPRTSW